MEFIAKTKQDRDITVTSNGFYVKAKLAGDEADFLITELLGDPVKGYSLRTSKGFEMSIRDEDMPKFNDLLPIMKKQKEGLAKKSLGVGCLGIVGIFIFLSIIVANLPEEKRAESANSLKRSNSPLTQLFAEQDQTIYDVRYNEYNKFLSVSVKLPENGNRIELGAEAATKIIKIYHIKISKIPQIEAIRMEAFSKIDGTDHNVFSMDLPMISKTKLDSNPNVKILEIGSNYEINDDANRDAEGLCMTQRDDIPKFCKWAEHLFPSTIAQQLYENSLNTNINGGVVNEK